jgi:hypothetical protein
MAEALCIMAHAFCELRHLGDCWGPIDRAHIIAKGKLRNIPGALQYCEDNAEILIGSVCRAHNDSRAHDTKENRASLLKVRCSIFGVDYVSGVLDGLRALTKTGMPEWRLSALLAA